LSHNLVIILKNRQIGCTWLVAGYAIWKAIFHKAQNIIIISKDEQAATEVLDYCRFIYNNLPDWLKPSLDRDRTALMSFPEIGSKIRALSATSASGIGFGAASLVILDENDFHPNAEDNYVEVKPMIDAGSGQLIILSAPNRLVGNSSFKTIWRGARQGENNFLPILLTFGGVPHHTEEWYQEKKREYSPRDFETRYFKTEIEALSVTTAGKYFDMDALGVISSRRIKPLVEVDFNTRNGIVKVYKEPVPGEKYLAYADPSMGVEDPTHLVIANAYTLEECAHYNAKVHGGEAAIVFDELVRWYNRADNSYEDNAKGGQAFSEVLDRMNTPRQQTRRDPDGKFVPGKKGYYMTHPLKREMYGNWANLIFSKKPVIHDMEAIAEHESIIYEEGSDVPVTPRPLHDDRVMCWIGIGWLYKFVPKVQVRLYTAGDL
tara:strand:- start:1441 stop:2739 length:1299 start_codon:yes stop_codon:yes gene_type:complete